MLLALVAKLLASKGNCILIKKDGDTLKVYAGKSSNTELKKVATKFFKEVHSLQN